MTSNNQHHDQDLLLARVLQEQEHAFHAMLMATISTANKASNPTEAYPSDTDGLTDEELARQLQSQEDPEYADEGAADQQYDYNYEVDYDHLSYEDYNAIGDAVGAVSKGLSKEVLQQLPRMPASKHLAHQKHCSCKQQDPQQQQQQGSTDVGVPANSSCTCTAARSLCVVCQCPFEGDEVVKVLPSCGHVYHEECIDQWLSNSKSCPVCHAEVKVASTSSKTSTSSKPDACQQVA